MTRISMLGRFIERVFRKIGFGQPISATELEARYAPQILQVGGLRLLPAEKAICLLDECANANVRFLGIEAFHLLKDGGVQPAMEFSNICYGVVERHATGSKFKWELRLRTPWNRDPESLKHSQTLIEDGVKEGFGWYEVSLEDIESNERLFFRRKP